MTKIDELAEAAKMVSDHIADVADAAEEATRLKGIRAMIFVNAIRGLGCTEEEATAYADGTSEKTFVQALIERFEGAGSVTQQRAAKALLQHDENGGRKAVYDACANRVKVYKFDAVLTAIAEGTSNA